MISVPIFCGKTITVYIACHIQIHIPIYSDQHSIPRLQFDASDVV
jgi:hypothetical protein